MLTVRSLLDDCGLEIAAAEASADNPVRWVHISEHEDPTPWLSGGELLLTTGYNLGTPTRQRRFVELLAGEGIAGLGFGTGFDHKRLPKAISEASAEHGLPLFEVPYEMPFIAITERASARLINEQFGVLERGVQVHERLERLVIEGHGLDEILAATGAAIGGTAIVLDRAGRELARGGDDPDGAAAEELAAELAARESSAPTATFAPEEGELAGRALAVPVPGRRGGAPVAWLAVVSEDQPLGDFERLCARQAAIVVGLELMRERIVRETERRLAGDLLADALGERLEPEELTGRLRPFGIGGEAAVLVFDLDDPPAAEATLESALSDAGVPALVATSAAAGRPLLCAVVDTASAEPVGTARRAREALTGGSGAQRRPGGRQPPRRRRLAAPGVPRGPLRARGDLAQPTATPPTSPRTAISVRSRCCSRSRTTTRCGSTATTSWNRSSAPRASTAASCCARWRRSSRTTATGSGPRASSTATATRFATGFARSRSSPAGT